MSSSLEKRIIDLIKQGKSNIEICQKLSLSNDTFRNILLNLKNKGLEYDKRYLLNGGTLYTPNKDQNGKSVSNSVTLLMKNKDELNALLISDLHLGTKEERLDLLNLVYDYATKSGIHIIINGGDLINGLTSERKNICQTHLRQCEYFIEKHPFDQGILNICVLGNHDVKGLNSDGINFARILENYRTDFAIAGVENGRVLVKNDFINMYHPLSCNCNNVPKKKLVLVGHSHQYKVRIINDNVLIYIPALSNYVPASKGIIPSFLKMKMGFTGGFIEYVDLENLAFLNDKVTSLGKQEIEIKRSLKKN